MAKPTASSGLSEQRPAFLKRLNCLGRSKESTDDDAAPDTPPGFLGAEPPSLLKIKFLLLASSALCALSGSSLSWLPSSGVVNCYCLLLPAATSARGARELTAQAKEQYEQGGATTGLSE